jgi:superfamily II DNA or RNA helicase
MALRDYQEQLDAKIDEAISNGSKSILATCPTGGGKTHLISHRANKANGPTVDIAHRQELVYQISMALARDDIWHRILAPDAVCRFIVRKQIKEFGRSRVHHSSPHTVASVDTLLARRDDLGSWINQVALAQIDEAHHCLPENKWGRALKLFPNALRIGWTATPQRTDREPLRGVFDTMVEGPSVAELLARGFLCRYRVYGPPPSIDVSGVRLSASGDFSPAELRKAAHKSTITGDMVSHYGKLTPGAVGIGFLVDVDQAKETCERFNSAAGAPLSVWMSSRETDDTTRVGNLEALARGDLKMIFNVDLLGEGVDVPRVEVILDGAPTESLGRYLQRFGRLLRTFPGKSVGHYVDLAGNVLRHGLPDTPRVWTLDTPDKRKRLPNDETALKACLSCFAVFERYKPRCPECGWKPEPAGRSLPEMVDGDLTEYDPELMARLRGEADKIMRAAPPGAAPYVVENWNARAVTQTELRKSIDLWAATEAKNNRDWPEVYRLFFHRFGIDVATAQTLGRRQAAELITKIWEDINNRLRPKGPVPAMVPVDDVFERAEGQRVGIRPSWSEARQRWMAQPTINGKQKPYRFKTKEACQAACDWLNAHPNEYLPAELDVDRERTRGVIRHKAKIYHNGKTVHIGSFKTLHEKLAAEQEYREKHGLQPKRFLNVSKRSEHAP